MGYEVIGSGPQAEQVGAPASPPDDVHDWVAPVQHPATVPPTRRPPWALALLVTAGVLAGGAALTHGRGGAGPTGRPTSSAPTSPTLAAGPTLSASTDLRTSVTIGHVRIAGRSYVEQVQALRQQLGAGAFRGARYGVQPDSPPGTGGVPTGVSVVFDGYLDSAVQRSLLEALDRLDPVAAVETVAGTAVDISVPVRIGSACVPVPGDGVPVLVMSAQDDVRVKQLLPRSGRRLAAGHATVSYVGSHRSTVDLREVGHLLAHACGLTPDDVTYTRAAV